MRPLPAILLCGCLAAALPAAAPPPARHAAPDDAHDLVVLHPQRPYRLRLRLRVGSTPFHVAWTAQMAVLFAHLDGNGDGVLSPAETRRAPSPAQWLQMTRGEQHLEPDAAPDHAALAAGHKEVRLRQLAAWYRASTAGPVQVSWGWRNHPGDPLSTSLWNRLDSNRDGKLSRAEVLAAPRVLAGLDTNEDEMLSAAELIGFRGRYYDGPAQVSSGAAHDLARGKLPFFSLVPGGPAAPLVHALLARYDRNRDGKLSGDEVHFPPALFRRLDADGDGRLDAGELARWLAEPVDVELAVPLEPQPRRGVEVVPGRPASVPVQPTRDGVQVILGDWALSVDGAGGTPPPPVVPATSELAEVFRLLDSDGNGYLDTKELYRPPFTYVSWLRLADRDGDGRLSQKEFIAFAALQGRLKGTATHLRVEDEGRSLFRLLDADRDGRLGARELRTAWQRLARWDREGKGLLSKDALPQSYRIVVRYARPFDLVTAYDTPGPIPRPERGPVWFRKMDRNGDGDVSLREWLGTREQFNKIDSNGDGLIGLEEAEAADRWFRVRR